MVIVAVALLLTGLAVTNFVGQWIVKQSNRLISHIPIVKTGAELDCYSCHKNAGGTFANATMDLTVVTFEACEVCHDGKHDGANVAHVVTGKSTAHFVTSVVACSACHTHKGQGGKVGPDLTGVFTGDCGALGFKVRATLPLVRRPPAVEALSFAFPGATRLLQAMAEIGRAGLASECFAFDAGLQNLRMKRASLLEDVKALGRVVGGAGSLLTGLKQGASVVMGGRSFLEDAECSLHVACEGLTTDEAAARSQQVRALAAAAGTSVAVDGKQ